MIGLVDEHPPRTDVPVADESYFGTADVTDASVEQAGEDDRAARLQAKKARHVAASANLALGLEMTAKLLEPTDQQVRAGATCSATCSAT
ncbi:hypothetical protein [Conexibacter woesei]|uniref:Uncharacterized protein n=1 Tax=Conexibacter woesei (strain DSM 14684 / CCUG 47730 / CIP 108061 / JCM 11494 / NBRC 100937 / ID131577) TaxID=469383 RepID=D3F0P7_CONWI|nr:hypothetical protein [Conexibacter woesei]ADB53981.1 hypothetical protein Cwoe_5576 [Conexibacter woesei DSM 14684]